MALARLLEGKNAARTLERVVAEPIFKAADSDTRFVRVYAALNRTPARSTNLELWRAPGGGADRENWPLYKRDAT